MTSGTIIETVHGFLTGGGEMGARMRALDWSQTPLGPVETWPQSLRTAIGMMLPSKAQIVFFWGSEFVVVYNDAYRPVFGGKHPQVLGRPGRIAWSEIWETGANLHGLLREVVRTGEAFSARDLLFVLERHGFVEETYFDVSYDPVRIESGDVGGVFCIVTETTGRVVGERRLALLRDLATHNASARSPREACSLAMQTFSKNSHDIRFALAYLNGELQACTPGAEDALAATDPSLVKVLSIGDGQLVVGVNPQRPLDDQHRSFLDLVAGQLTTAIANAEAYEEERKRGEALAALDRAKTTFFSNVSHEFRTPLTLMLGPVEDALADTSQPLLPTQRERLELARRNALRLLKMVNSLLDFARIEARRIEAVYEPTDLAAFTAELASTFRSTIERAGLRFVLAISQLPQPVYVDREMWEKIVLNLLSNAFKFTLAGEIRVSLQAIGDVICLDVSDTGSGIPAEELPHVFERFHRVERTPGRTQEGTGIGLALVQELVRLHGGEVSVESSLNAGSTFRVTLRAGNDHLPKDRLGLPRTLASTALGAAPYVEEALRWLPAADRFQPLSQSTDGETPRAAPDTQQPRPRILLADDNADMRNYVTRLLEQRYDVESVADGREALSALRNRRPDLVISDVMMPTLDGFGLLHTLREDAETRELPVLLLSARAGEEARIEGMQAGADDYLVKPFSARELLARVDAHLTMAQLRRVSAERERVMRQEAERMRILAEEANQVKAAFLATMSHELRTPLNAIMGYTGLLDAEIAGPLTIGQRQQTGRIETATRHLLQIIEEILTFSRIEAGREEVHLESVDFVPIVVETCKLVEPLATQKSLEFSCHTPERLIGITDPGKLRQILLNLLSNAIKFTDRGEVRLDVSVTRDEITFEIRDTGIGIDAAQQERVFDPFHQVDRMKAQSFGGTGLGLSVSRELARLLGGDITLKSVPGVGSTFTLRLPRVSEAQTLPEPR